MASDFITRFRAKITINQAGCHIYNGSWDSGGYGMVWFKGKGIKAHRAAWTIIKGPIPQGRMILHKCDNPACVNVEHLFLGNQTDNMRDMISKGRRTPLPGTANGRAALTEKQVLEILDLLRENKLTQAEIGERYKVAQTTISYIKGKGWACLKGKENVLTNI